MEENDQNVRTGKEMEAGPSQIMEESEADSPRCNALEPKHKVFLSHSCAQKDFVEQLCIDLERCHRFPFFDKLRSSLPIGERFPEVIFDAIRQCHVGVLVLSKEFFERTKWPMVELVAMVKELMKPNSTIKIIPIFYHISHEEWKDSKNRSTWILQWEKWANEDKRIKVDEWKEALEILKPINGLVISKHLGGVNCRAEIVKEVCKVVLPEIRWDDSHVQGRLRLCKIIHEKINQQKHQNGVQVMGLYGMGGIGKTTICKAMCNEMFQKFYGRVCHVELNSTSEIELLREVLKRLTNTQHELLGELNVDQCRDQLKRCIMQDAVFLAIDNVSNNLETLRQAKTYLGAKWGEGSVIIVTARSRNELMCLNQYLDENDCVRMPNLKKIEATSLFLSHVASGRSAMIEMDEGLVSRCVERCYFSKGEGMDQHYIPLALQVLGVQFGSIGYNAELWDAQLKKIDTFDLGLFGNKHPIFSILRSSYDSLSPEVQMLFMDVALLLPTYGQDDCEYWHHHYTLFDWLSMVHGSNAEEMMSRLKGLKRKSLLENLGNGLTRLSMHDLWREFCVAETKVGKIGDQRRWLYVEEESSELGEISPSGRCRENLKRMCFLNKGWRCLNGVQLGDFVNVSVLKLDIGSFVSTSELDLDLTGLNHLKSLELRTPTLNTKCLGFISLRNLVFLSWVSRRAFSPCIEDIGRLTKLQVLNMKGFRGGKLPNLSMLESLRVVSLTCNSKVVTIRGLSSKLTNLRHLNLFWCSSLEECPGVGQLYALEELHLWGCSKLKEQPCLRLLTKLRILDISYCKLLKAVPGLSDLVALRNLAAVTSGLASLPDMRKLTKLRIWVCPNLPKLGVLDLCALPRLEKMDFSGCTVLKSLPCGKPLVALKEINFSLCRRLEEMPDLIFFPQLRVLQLSGCASLMTLVSSMPVPALRILDLEGCSRLSALPEYLSSSVDLRELRLQKSGIVLSGEDMKKLEVSCKRLMVYPSSARSKYGHTITGLDNRGDESDDMEINSQSQCWSRRLPDSLPRDKITRLVYDYDGDSLLALTSNGMHKVWNWGEFDDSEIGFKPFSGQATVSFAPQLWQHRSGVLMINDVNDANPEEVVPCMAICKNGPYTLISASGGKVSVFYLEQPQVFGHFLETPSTATSLAFYPHDSSIIAIGMEDSTIQIRYIFPWKELVCTLKGHQERITCLAFSKSQSVMVSLGADAQLCMWRTDVWSTDGWMKRLPKFAPLQPDVRSPCMGDIRIQFHSNQVHLLVVGESQLALYDALKLDRLHQWVPQSPFLAAITDAVYSCDSQLVYTSFVDGSVGVFDAENLQAFHRLAPPLHTPRGLSGDCRSTVYPLAVAAHPSDRNQFALGLSNGDVLVMEPFGNKRVKKLLKIAHRWRCFDLLTLIQFLRRRKQIDKWNWSFYSLHCCRCSMKVRQ